MLLTEDEVCQVFTEHDGEFLKFDRVKEKFSNRKDLHAFILMDRLVPKHSGIISGASHDVIFLEVSIEDLKVATKEQIIDLIRSGVMNSSEYDCLTMFV